MSFPWECHRWELCAEEEGTSLHFNEVFLKRWELLCPHTELIQWFTRWFMQVTVFFTSWGSLITKRCIDWFWELSLNGGCWSRKKKYLSYSVSHIIFRENESDVIQLNWFKKQISVIPGFLVSYLYLLIFHTFVHSLCIFCSVPPLWANNKKPMNQSLSGGLPSVWWAPKFIHGAGMEEREGERIIKTVYKAWKYMQSSFWKATLFKLWEHFAIIYRITTSKQYISPETL